MKLKLALMALGALAVVLVVVGFAASRAAGGIVALGTAISDTRHAQGQAEAEITEAEGKAALSNAQAEAVIIRATSGSTPLPPMKLDAPPIPQEPHVTAALQALAKVIEMVGEDARFFPPAKELGGAVRDALGPLKSVGAIRTITGRGGGSYVDGYPNLRSLAQAVASGDLPLPRPPSSESLMRLENKDA